MRGRINVYLSVQKDESKKKGIISRPYKFDTMSPKTDISICMKVQITTGYVFNRI